MSSLRIALPLAMLATLPMAAQNLADKSRLLQKNLTERHMLDGLYVSIVPAVDPGVKLLHTVDEPGNVIHAGVWTGRYLAGVGYQYAVTHDPAVRRHGGEILHGLRVLREVTGKAGLLARGYVKGHGPVAGFERGGDSREWHQGQGKYADYRFYSDVSVDNFNAVLYGYAIYYDLAADAAQKAIISEDVDRLMTHLLDNHYRIVDLDGEVTQYGHVGIDPDPSRDPYYLETYARTLARYSATPGWRPSLRSCLMALPDLLIAHRLTGKPRYLDEYRKVVARFRDNPEPPRDRGPFSLQRVARVNHSSEGQAYEALFNLIRYETDPGLQSRYREWMSDLWEMNWMEGNALFTYMTVALAPKDTELPRREEALRLANETLRLYPTDRVMRPVMNSLRRDLETNSFADRMGQKQSAKPIPINERPLDNEYAWKGNPYQMDGWLKPAITALRFSCVDPLVVWFSDSAGRIYMTRDGMKIWHDMSAGLMGARVKNIAPSETRTFVLYAETDRGPALTRDGGMHWHSAGEQTVPAFRKPEFGEWQKAGGFELRIDDKKRLLRRTADGEGEPAMAGWRIPLATSVFVTPRGAFAAGPGGAYASGDGKEWKELRLWPESETGSADFLHAYWMGRYYRYIQ